MSDLDPQQVASRVTGHFQTCFPPRSPVMRPVFPSKVVDEETYETQYGLRDPILDVFERFFE